jgi:hypothetical protein
VTVVTPDDDALAKLADEWRLAINQRDAAVIVQAFKDRKVPNLSSIALHCICVTGREPHSSRVMRGVIICSRG